MGSRSGLESKMLSEFESELEFEELLTSEQLLCTLVISSQLNAGPGPKELTVILFGEPGSILPNL